tara:strand:+ start:6476 stop:6991 length:516 start_codon:yes stop_codon:yes gene_type:complete
MTQTQLAFKNNAKNSTEYGGKRFLGFTPKGAEVWISFHIDRETLKASISTTHNLDALKDPRAKLAIKRVTLKRGGSNRNSAQDLMRKNIKNMGGEVTLSTLTYLEKLVDAIDRGYGKPFVNGQISSLMFSYLSQAIFEGSYDHEYGDNIWTYIMKEWPFPSGEYFTVLGLP